MRARAREYTNTGAHKPKVVDQVVDNNQSFYHLFLHIFAIASVLNSQLRTKLSPSEISQTSTKGKFISPG